MDSRIDKQDYSYTTNVQFVEGSYHYQEGVLGLLTWFCLKICFILGLTKNAYGLFVIFLGLWTSGRPS